MQSRPAVESFPVSPGAPSDKFSPPVVHFQAELYTWQVCGFLLCSHCEMMEWDCVHLPFLCMDI